MVNKSVLRQLISCWAYKEMQHRSLRSPRFDWAGLRWISHDGIISLQQDNPHTDIFRSTNFPWLLVFIAGLKTADSPSHRTTLRRLYTCIDIYSVYFHCLLKTPDYFNLCIPQMSCQGSVCSAGWAEGRWLGWGGGLWRRFQVVSCTVLLSCNNCRR